MLLPLSPHYLVTTWLAALQPILFCMVYTSHAGFGRGFHSRNFTARDVKNRRIDVSFRKCMNIVVSFIPSRLWMDGWTTKQPSSSLNREKKHD